MQLFTEDHPTPLQDATTTPDQDGGGGQGEVTVAGGDNLEPYPQAPPSLSVTSLEPRAKTHCTHCVTEQLEPGGGATYPSLIPSLHTTAIVTCSTHCK